jgi:formiminotetrahydrofolate cyclodeaminase
MIKDQKIEQFLKEVASKKPTPGGGAVAAVVGAMAAGLVEMVCALTKNKDTKILKYKVNKARQQLLRLADEDAAAFDAVVLAYRAKNKLKIKKALQKAIAIPERTEKLSKEVEELAKVIVKVGNKNALSDAKTAVYLAVAAQASARENIGINKTALKKLGS